MSDRRVIHPFWGNARKKADANDRCAMSVAKQQDNEVKRDGVPGVSAASTISQPVQNTQGGEAKRQKVFEQEEASTSHYQTEPSDKPLFKTTASVGRRWQFTRQNGTRHRSRTVQFTIISYNVLADFLLNSHPMLYNDCDEWLLQWEYRKKNLLKEILHYDADILCLQEVQEQHFVDWFQPELTKAGYHGLYKKRTGDKVDGCAIFYRNDKFTLVTVRYLDYRMDNVAVMDRDNIAILALFHPKYKGGRTCNNTALCVANTHLLFNRNRGDIKLLQLASLFAEIDKLKKEFIVDKTTKQSTNKIQKIPVVLCGDFNTTPFCPLYHFISTGTLNYNNLSKKDLSGQNQVHRHHRYNAGDLLKRNIIPQEMCLTNTSTWDNTQTTNRQTVDGKDGGLKNNDDVEWPALTSSRASCASTDHGQDMSRLHATAGTSSRHSESTSGRTTCASTHHVQDISLWHAEGGTASKHSELTSSRASCASTDHGQEMSCWHPEGGTSSKHSELTSGRTSCASTHHVQETSRLNTSACTSSKHSESKHAGNPQELPKPIQYDPGCTFIRHRLYFWSVYRHLFRDNNREVTTYHGSEPSSTVDYIFASPGRNEMCRTCRQRHGVMELTGSLGLLSEEELALHGGLPSPILSSDHLALVASFALHL